VKGMKILSPISLSAEGVHSFKGVCDESNKPVNVILNMKSREEGAANIGATDIES